MTEARPLLSRITTADAASLAIRFDLPKIRTADAGARRATWKKGSTRMRVKKPDGTTRAFELAPVPATEDVPLEGSSSVLELALDGQTLGQWKKYEWREPDAKLLATPGRYVIHLDGQLDVDGSTVAFETGDVPVEVVAESPSFLSIAALDAAAVFAVASRIDGGAPQSGKHIVVDDVEDGRWVRMSLNEPVRGYDIRIVDIRLSPGGAVLAMSDFLYFTCVALGTPIATPRGDALVEQLREGDTVWAFDVATSRRLETKLVRIETSHREDLIDLGGALSVTPEHPIFADGKWTPARDVTTDSALLDVDGHSRSLPSLAIKPGVSVVFNLSTEWPHTFFAGGILVHNKAVPTQIAPGDPWRGIFLRKTDVPQPSPIPTQ